MRSALSPVQSSPSFETGKRGGKSKRPRWNGKPRRSRPIPSFSLPQWPLGHVLRCRWGASVSLSFVQSSSFEDGEGGGSGERDKGSVNILQLLLAPPTVDPGGHLWVPSRCPPMRASQSGNIWDFCAGGDGTHPPRSQLTGSTAARSICRQHECPSRVWEHLVSIPAGQIDSQEFYRRFWSKQTLLPWASSS